jgi:16S rRNA (uracil1498-N3)-methyltransferase
MLLIDGQTRPRETVPDLWLLAAPVKKDRFQMIVEKATELGIARIIPVLTERSHAPLAKADKLRHYLIEAAEQCERTALPALDPPQRLDALLAAWPAERGLFFADERLHSETSQTDLCSAMASHDGPAAILIGPEGGFTDVENAAIRAHAAAVPISLGPRILRAETAAIAAISLWMAQHGDWVSQNQHKTNLQ